MTEELDTERTRVEAGIALVRRRLVLRRFLRFGYWLFYPSLVCCGALVLAARFAHWDARWISFQPLPWVAAPVLAGWAAALLLLLRENIRHFEAATLIDSRFGLQQRLSTWEENRRLGREGVLVRLQARDALTRAAGLPFGRAVCFTVPQSARFLLLPLALVAAAILLPEFGEAQPPLLESLFVAEGTEGAAGFKGEPVRSGKLPLATRQELTRMRQEVHQALSRPTSPAAAEELSALQRRLELALKDGALPEASRRQLLDHLARIKMKLDELEKAGEAGGNGSTGDMEERPRETPLAAHLALPELYEIEREGSLLKARFPTYQALIERYQQLREGRRQ